MQADGKTRGRSYTLSPRVYREIGQAAESVRQAGFDGIQQVEMVRRFVRDHREIRRSDAMALCRITGPEATRLLRRLCVEGALVQHGSRKGAFYAAGSNI